MSDSLPLVTIAKPQRELEAYLNRSTEVLADLLLDLSRAYLRGDVDAIGEARENLRLMLADTMALADLLGRRRLLLEADALRDRNQVDGFAPMLFADGSDEVSPILPDVPFERAIDDLTTREPRLANTADEVRDLYRSSHSFSALHATDLKMTRRIQDALIDAAAEGLSEPNTVKVIEEITGWTRSYAGTVYRTNTNTAYNAGRFQQARDPDVSEVIGALKFLSADDEDTRPNHRAAHGLIASPSDPVWDYIAPPLGYNCRCSVILVDRWDLKKMGLIQGDMVIRKEPPGFAAAGPDEGFGGGSSRGIYG